ncbi:DNA-binding transcriptional regulator [Paenibacillus mucilaginosus 3016]|uniref:DNA-binding transcriptional regulator n=1 Tax=Paenibacillus mucilaginosus 3016 TaxID=1116391 RepID=H6NLF7_9BACL|nr:helix-turn-helix domain-containing protein [Paenibacillus mucilaginosus]AFC30339.1 DNA-binding transcriptional regulator [Paenibacillus mucilaginosus 3016]WFA18973.1 PucR family transcriptional regulator [Paenibacillus mucilaginosus]
MPMPSDELWYQRSFDSLEELADAISEVLRCPVTIEDASFRLLAYSSHTPSTDPARIATIISRRVPDHVIASLWKEGVLTRLMESDEPVRIPGIAEVGLGPRVAVSIRRSGTVLGHIWVIEENRSLTEEDLEQLLLGVSAARTKLLQHQTQRRKEQESLQDFFWQLLTGHLRSHAAAAEKAARLQVSLPASFATAILQFGRELPEKLAGEIPYLLSAAGRIRFPLFALHRDQLILLAECRDARSLRDLEESLAQLGRLLLERSPLESCVAGAGLVYEDYSLLEQSYREAQTVLGLRARFPEETSHRVLYRDLGFYRWLPLFHEHNEAGRYANPSLEKLRAYDREHHGSLIDTLETYLSCDSNLKEAAERLHIHANSLAYRLKRITEIGGIDLASMDQKVTLYLDLKTEKLKSPRL